MYALERDISADDINQLHMNQMPGFKLEWHYNENVGPPEHVDEVLPWKCYHCVEFKR